MFTTIFNTNCLGGLLLACRSAFWDRVAIRSGTDARNCVAMCHVVAHARMRANYCARIDSQPFWIKLSHACLLWACSILPESMFGSKANW